MLCEKCGKNQATVWIKHVINNKEINQHLCENCANEFMDIGNFSLDKFFNNGAWNENFGMNSALSEEIGSRLKCPVCGMTYSDYRKSGKLGCSECYETFRDRIMPLVRSVHGKNKHVGKVKDNQIFYGEKASEKTMTAEEEAKYYEKLALQKQMQELVASEKFEEAAKVRDKIKEIDNALKEK